MSAAVLASLVLGITANSAVFSVLYGTLLRPLSFDDPDRLVYLQAFNPETPSEDVGFDPALFDALEWRKPSSFERLVGMVGRVDLTLQTEGSSAGASRVRGAVVSADFFRLLGVHPAYGRDFETAEEAPGRGEVAVLSDGLWRRRFGGDPSILGRSLRINDQPFTIIGVMPRGFGFPAGVEVWVPGPGRTSSLRNLAVFVQSNYQALGRLVPQVDLAAAEEELRAVYGALRAGYPERSFIAQDLRVLPLQEKLVGDSRRTLILLQIGVAAVLLICCANVGGLLLVKEHRRRRDVAVRYTLGARPVHLLRQHVTELALLFLLGGVLSLLLSSWMLRMLVVVAPVSWFDYAEIGLDAVSMGFTLLLCVVCAVATGLVPVVSGLRPDLMQVVKAGGMVSRKPLNWGRVVVAGEIALAVALVVGAGLVTRSLVELQDRELGFAAKDVLAFEITLLESRHESEEERSRWATGFRRALDEIPGVEAVGASQYFFVTEGVFVSFLSGWDGAEEDEEVKRLTGIAYVTPGYFESLEIPLLAGRPLTERTIERGLQEAVVSRSFAEELWPGQDAVGRQLEIERRTWTVVGVVGDVTLPSVVNEGGPEVFIPHSLARLSTGEMTYLVKGRSADSSLAGSVRATLQAYDPEQAIGEMATLEEIVARELAPQRYASILLGSFAGLAVLLGALGIYGTVSFAVTERTAEIGTRMAMGATTRRILAQVLWSSTRLGAAGASAGVLLGLLLARGLGNLIHGIAPWDPWAWLAAVVLGLLIPIVASLAPAGRAARMAPSTALRESSGGRMRS